MKRMLALVLPALLAGAAHGAVYKWKDSDGGVHYSDQPQPGAVEVEKVPIQTYKPAPIPVRASPNGRRQDADTTYDSLAFVSPSNDTTIRDNQGNIAIQLSIEPPLRSGHSIALTIDGQRQEQSVNATTFTLSNVARGTHTLQASVIDDQGNELMNSDTLTLHMVRQSELFKPQDPDQPADGPIQQAPRAPQAPRFNPDPKTSKF